MSFFSIQTVCLNAGDDLHITVKSVLGQEFTDYELIIKDGGSRDGSIEKLPQDKRIRLYLQNDSGIYDAMNQSLNYIKGKYLVFLNAGDTFNSPSDLFTIYNEINQNPDYGLYYCDYKTTGLDKRVYSPKRLHKFTLFRNMLCHQCCFFQIDKFRVTGFFNTKYKVVADYDFLLRFIILNKFCSKHIDLLGIISKSGGYASLNQRKSKQEVEMIRREIFGNKYFINNLLLEMTFPSLRNRLMTSKSLIVKHFYLDIINFINQKV